jgi:hypothetical protein
MSPDQKRQKDEARREAIMNTYDVCADGEKHKESYDKFSNMIDEQGLDK